MDQFEIKAQLDVLEKVFKELDQSASCDTYSELVELIISKVDSSKYEFRANYCVDDEEKSKFKGDFKKIYEDSIEELIIKYQRLWIKFRVTLELVECSRRFGGNREALNLHSNYSEVEEKIKKQIRKFHLYKSQIDMFVS
ncbi:hypothetical protein COE55_17910 [Priestia megaterium]|uniref:hypothetical protein n=1 Tax=Priestia megaterium TaxID=1404 RepID=UPI000BFDE220|nr:hypothetical protein [Priestia megaterium]PGZ77312.1 hypothetical protein COE55_17910 [Priestia megaterium]